ncbi:MAG TPA: GAF domain-containing protein, partial [Abditibacteriaceae bacterium]
MIAPLPPNEAERLQVLRDYDILDTPPEMAFERLVNMAARLFDVPIALVSLVDSERQWSKACFGVDTRESSREVSFCAHAILSRKVLVVPDALADMRFSDNPVVTGGPGIRFYAGAPLQTPSGHNLGS